MFVGTDGSRGYIEEIIGSLRNVKDSSSLATVVRMLAWSSMRSSVNESSCAECMECVMLSTRTQLLGSETIAAGTLLDYRCPRCQHCAACRRGERVESVSLRAAKCFRTYLRDGTGCMNVKKMPAYFHLRDHTMQHKSFQ